MDLGLRIACLQHVPYEGPGVIADWARSRHHRLAVTRLYERGGFPSAESFDWLVVLGGPMGVHDDTAHPWLAAEKSLIRWAIEDGRTVFGVCLGAQLVAQVLGAAVGRGPEREIGWHPVQLTPEARAMPALAGLPETFTPFHWHADAFAVPEGGTLIASSAGCREQGFVWGDRVVGLQFHLETTADGVDALVEHCPGDLEPGRFVQGAAAMREGAARHAGQAHGILASLLDALPGAGTLLTTERLRLRRMRPGDAARIVALDSDPEVKRWIDQGRPPDADRIREEVLPRWIAAYEGSGGMGFFAAEDRLTGEFLGWFHLKPWTGEEEEGALELGYRLHRHRWGLGLATEGSLALIEAAFSRFGARQVVARAMAANTSSVRVLEKCGLTFLREYEEHRFPGEDRQAVVYGLDEESYRDAED